MVSFQCFCSFLTGFKAEIHRILVIILFRGVPALRQANGADAEVLLQSGWRHVMAQRVFFSFPDMKVLELLPGSLPPPTAVLSYKWPSGTFWAQIRQL